MYLNNLDVLGRIFEWAKYVSYMDFAWTPLKLEFTKNNSLDWGTIMFTTNITLFENKVGVQASKESLKIFKQKTNLDFLVDNYKIR